MPSRRTSKSNSLSTKTAELAFAAPQVIAHRLTRMALSGPTPSARDLKEFRLMFDEKNVAFTQSWMAMATQMALANQALAFSLTQAFWSPFFGRNASFGSLASQMQSAGLSILDKGIAPMHRKARSNAKRLARTRLL